MSHKPTVRLSHHPPLVIASRLAGKAGSCLHTRLVSFAMTHLSKSENYSCHKNPPLVLVWVQQSSRISQTNSFHLGYFLAVGYCYPALRFRASLITLFCFPTGSFSQLLRYQNTHLAMLNSVFGALYLKKIPALVFQKELIEVPYTP